MDVVTQVEEVRRLRWQDPTLTWGLVPTMGALHAGHLSLVEHARRQNQRVGVSIFVNPTQFNDPKDLERYPRTLDEDLALLEKAGVDLVWTPSVDVMYPPHFQTYVIVEEISKPLEGAARPNHFRGVATVVLKLFNVFQPTRAYFGQKDAQQLAVIQRMVQDLNVNVEIVPCPTIREADGLALSSRNRLLSPEDRPIASMFYQALLAAQSTFQDGVRDANTIKKIMTNILSQEPRIQIDYLSVADPTTLQEIEGTFERALVSGAIFLGGVRLIDNIIIGEKT
ncbi:MAG: pantoate--beta-alanine ligase [Phototrophicales bacterium]|nr:MAG: pantoate--beta-alanine ligase [Phototrophicales bacterium]